MPSGITIVGLGPGDPQYWTVAALRTLEQAQEVWSNTTHLPAHLQVRSLAEIGDAETVATHLVELEPSASTPEENF